MMQKPITDIRLVDISRFRIGNAECLISSMAIGSVFQILMQSEDVIRQKILEILNVFLVSFSLQKFPPGSEQVFKRNDILIGMNEPDFTHTQKRTPPSEFLQPKLIPVVLKLKEAYGIWQEYLPHFPKANRYTLGSKIDDVFLAAIEYCFLASYSASSEKQILLDRAISRTDLIKLLLQLAWDIRVLDTKKYIHLSKSLAEIGKMLGGWKRQLANKTPGMDFREKKY